MASFAPDTPAPQQLEEAHENERALNEETARHERIVAALPAQLEPLSPAQRRTVLLEASERCR